MEEALPAGCGGLLQLAGRVDRYHTCGSYRISCVAVGTRLAEVERHPSDASSYGVRVEPSYLGSMVHPQASPAPTRSSASRISFADRSSGCDICSGDRALGRFSQRSEWTGVEVIQHLR